tara:strand:- start:99 stop:239 length:141 start_codon:yes stop_codon:yes gene_type:complete
VRKDVLSCPFFVLSFVYGVVSVVAVVVAVAVAVVVEDDKKVWYPIL